MPMTTRGRKLPAGFWKGSTSKGGKARRAVKSLAPRTRKAMTTIATRVLNRAVETKYVAEPVNVHPIDIYGDVLPAGGLPQLFDVLPGIGEGTAEFQRTGTKVSPTRHTVDLDLRFNQIQPDVSGATSLADCAWDITAHVWYGYAKRFNNEADVIANAALLLNQQFEDGQGNTTRWKGDPLADFTKLNTEVFSLKHKAVRMYRPLGTQNDATIAGGVTTYFPQNMRSRMTLSFKPPKSLLYSEISLLPENYAPIVIIGYCHNDFTQAANTALGAPTVLNRPALQACFFNHLWFKDA